MKTTLLLTLVLATVGSTGNLLLRKLPEQVLTNLSAIHASAQPSRAATGKLAVFSAPKLGARFAARLTP